MQKSRTASGVEVTLDGIEHSGRPVVRAIFTNPRTGKAVGIYLDRYGLSHTQPPVRGAFGWLGEEEVCLTIPEADYQRALAEVKGIGERELADLREGRTPITVRYHDGEYLDGYRVFSPAAELLVGLGLARPVEGWGTLVDAAAVKALGETFTYEQAVAYARPALEAKQAARDEAEAARREKFAEAARTGRPVLLSQGADECDGTVEDCTWDDVQEYALPDGSTRVERTHTY